MARDPGRYLVIPGDKLMRLPSYSPQVCEIFLLINFVVQFHFYKRKMFWLGRMKKS
jgi:hypothetical protein